MTLKLGLSACGERWKKPLTLTWQEFNQLPRTTLTLDLHCVTKWSKLDTVWEGVSLKTLRELGLVIPIADAHYVIQHAEYGFTANLPIEVVLADNFCLRPITTAS